jgi:phage/plasmid-like protein (TIGR03299 family)
MSHEIYEINGEHSMAYLQGVMPWHGLGQPIDPDEPLEVWAVKGHVNYRVEESPVVFDVKAESALYNGRLLSAMHRFEGKKVLYRSDTGEPFAVVSEGYKVVQPIQILEFFRNLTEIHGLKLHTVGSLRGGKRVWGLASIPKGIKLGTDDILYPYVLLATSYDKSLSTTGKLTAVQVVCNNTLEMAYNNEGGPCVKVPHSATFDPDQVKLDLGLAEQSVLDFAAKIDRLSSHLVTKEEASQFFLDLFHNPDNGDDYSDVPKRVVRNLGETYLRGVGQDKHTTDGTAWGLVTAVTRYYDHEAQSRGQDYRLESAWFGRGNSLKSKALSIADKLAA